MQVDGIKRGILKDVEINANELMNTVKDEQVFHPNPRRMKNEGGMTSNEIFLLDSTPEKIP